MILLINKHEKNSPFKLANPMYALCLQQQIHAAG